MHKTAGRTQKKMATAENKPAERCGIWGKAEHLNKNI